MRKILKAVTLEDVSTAYFPLTFHTQTVATHLYVSSRYLWVKFAKIQIRFI